jgi:hypothetical protein
MTRGLSKKRPSAISGLVGRTDTRLVATAAASSAAAEASTKKVARTFQLSDDLVQRLRNLAAWRRRTLDSLAHEAIDELLLKYEANEITLNDFDNDQVVHKPAGEPYPEFAGTLRPGRRPKFG